MAFESKHLFFQDGVQDFVPAKLLDCIICTAPVLCRSKKRTASDLGDLSGPASIRPRKSHHKARGLGDQSALAPKKTFPFFELSEPFSKAALLRFFPVPAAASPKALSWLFAFPLAAMSLVVIVSRRGARTRAPVQCAGPSCSSHEGVAK
jgi:hypothetical protein